MYCFKKLSNPLINVVKICMLSSSYYQEYKKVVTRSFFLLTFLLGEKPFEALYGSRLCSRNVSQNAFTWKQKQTMSKMLLGVNGRKACNFFSVCFIIINIILTLIFNWTHTETILQSTSTSDLAVSLSIDSLLDFLDHIMHVCLLKDPQKFLQAAYLACTIHNPCLILCELYLKC